jgi:hypothetical protein
MSSLTSIWRRRRRVARTQRALDSAVAHANGPAMRDEIFTIANSAQFYNLPR